METALKEKSSMYNTLCMIIFIYRVFFFNVATNCFFFFLQLHLRSTGRTCATSRYARTKRSTSMSKSSENHHQMLHGFLIARVFNKQRSVGYRTFHIIASSLTTNPNERTLVFIRSRLSISMDLIQRKWKSQLSVSIHSFCCLK